MFAFIILKCNGQMMYIPIHLTVTILLHTSGLLVLQIFWRPVCKLKQVVEGVSMGEELDVDKRKENLRDMK